MRIGQRTLDDGLRVKPFTSPPFPSPTLPYPDASIPCTQTWPRVGGGAAVQTDLLLSLLQQATLNHCLKTR